MKNLPSLMFFITNDKLIEDYMPWLVALFIGILSAIINLIIANKSRRTNQKNLELQIENSKQIVKTEFKATIATNNRQNWINEIRNEISNLLTNLILVADERDKDKERDQLEKVLFSKSKIELLTNGNKQEQSELVDKIQLLIDNVIETSGELEPDKFSQLRQDVIESARDLFSIHWKKIKNIN